MKRRNFIQKSSISASIVLTSGLLSIRGFATASTISSVPCTAPTTCPADDYGPDGIGDRVQCCTSHCTDPIDNVSVECRHFTIRPALTA